MNSTQIKLFSTMKKLIVLGNRRFVIRKDRDYLSDLLEIGITEEEAWNHILTLNKHFFYIDPKPIYAKSGEALIFIRDINEVTTYIKLKIENDNGKDEVVCLSFHKDNKKGRRQNEMR